MSAIWVNGQLAGSPLKVQVEAAHIEGPLAVTRALRAAEGGACIGLANGPRRWTVTHVRTGWSITSGRVLTRRQAICWLRRALKANDWERETLRTWLRKSDASRQRIWKAMTGASP